MVGYQLDYRDTGSSLVSIQLPASKSLANRALIIAALADSLHTISNLSEADDTRILYEALSEADLPSYDAGHGGTTFRFLLAYKAILGHACILSGSERLCQRPVGPLVEALVSLGADIKYLDKEGYPPLEVKGFKASQNEISIPANISSQFISALLMMAPCLPLGLCMNLEGPIFSRPYIQMTLSMMSYFGIDYKWEGKRIEIKSGRYKARPYEVEADWSAASYIYTLAALLPEKTFEIKGLQANSWQGDAKLQDFGLLLGVTSTWKDNTLYLKQSGNLPAKIHFHLLEQPDLAQALAVAIAGLNKEATFSGLDTLRIKETDRIQALHKELSKLGYRLSSSELDKEEIFTLKGGFSTTALPIFDTYHDHRMAMCLACLAIRQKVVIKDPAVVSKSFPGFWAELSKVGINCEVFQV